MDKRRKLAMIKGMKRLNMNKLEAKLHTKPQDITERTHNKFRGVRQVYTEVRDKVSQIDADLRVLRNQMTEIDQWPAR
jgi:hypothetical protein